MYDMENHSWVWRVFLFSCCLLSRLEMTFKYQYDSINFNPWQKHNFTKARQLTHQKLGLQEEGSKKKVG